MNFNECCDIYKYVKDVQSVSNSNDGTQQLTVMLSLLVTVMTACSS